MQRSGPSVPERWGVQHRKKTKNKTKSNNRKGKRTRIVALRSPVWPTMSGLAKLMRTIWNFPESSASLPASQISRAFMSGFLLNTTLSDGICTRHAHCQLFGHSLTLAAMSCLLPGIWLSCFFKRSLAHTQKSTCVYLRHRQSDRICTRHSGCSIPARMCVAPG